MSTMSTDDPPPDDPSYAEDNQPFGDPYRWSSGQLSDYLAAHTTLHNDTLDKLGFHELSGRAFLQLKKDDLKELGIEQYGRRFDVLDLVKEFRRVSVSYQQETLEQASNIPLPPPSETEIMSHGTAPGFTAEMGLGLLNRDEAVVINCPFKAGTKAEVVRVEGVEPDGMARVEEEGWMAARVNGGRVKEGTRTLGEILAGGSKRAEEDEDRMPPAEEVPEAEEEVLEVPQIQQTVTVDQDGRKRVAVMNVVPIEELDTAMDIEQVMNVVSGEGLRAKTEAGQEEDAPIERDVEQPTERPTDQPNLADEAEERAPAITVDSDGRKRVAVFNTMSVAARQSEIDAEHQAPEAPQPTQHILHKRTKRRFLGHKARKIDSLFYDVDIGDEIYDSYDEEDDFFYCARERPVGERQYVARQLKRLHLRLDNGEGQVRTIFNGHLRGAVMYHDKITLLKKHERLSFTVIDVIPPHTKLHRENTDSFTLPWTSSSDAPTARKYSKQVIVHHDGEVGQNEQWPHMDEWAFLDKWNHVEGGDEVLPVFGDSGSENEMDEEGFPSNTRTRTSETRTMRLLTPEEIRQAVEEGIEDVVLRWKQKKLPRLEAQAYGLWRKSKKRRERKARIAKATVRIKELNERLEAQKKETITAAVQWTSPLQIKKICHGNMALTIEEREISKWIVDVMKRKEEPLKPVKKSRVRRDGAEADEMEEYATDAGDEDGDDESLGSSEDEVMEEEENEMEGFIVGDDVDNVDPAEMSPSPEPLPMQTQDSGPMELDSETEDSATEARTRKQSLQPTRTQREVTMIESDSDTSIKLSQHTPRHPRRQSQAVLKPIELSSGDEITPLKTEPKTPGALGIVRKMQDGGTMIDLTQASPQGSQQQPDVDPVEMRSSPAPTQQKPKTRRAQNHPKRSEALQKILKSFDHDDLEALWEHIKKLRNELENAETDFDVLVNFTNKALFVLPEPLGKMARHHGCSETEEVLYRLIGRCYAQWRFPLERVPADYKISKSNWKMLDDVVQYERFFPDLEDEVDHLHQARGEERWRSRTKRSHRDPYGEDSELERGHNRKRRKPVKEDMDARAQRERQARTEAQIAERWESQRENVNLEQDAVLINRGHRENEADIVIHPWLGRALKPHQIEGVLFMWRQLVQIGVNRGGLLAHTMGLGKTLQVITVLHTIATAAKSEDKAVYSQIPPHLRESKTIIICPPGLVENWWEEFHKWLPCYDDKKEIDWSATGHLRRADGSLDEKDRVKHIDAWAEDGGILLIGYATFRNFIHIDTKNGKKNPQEHERIKKILLTQATIIIADEAHYLKNPSSKTTIAAKMFKYKTRIAMTGSPLSNSLEEYWSMIEWVDPGFLGPLAEFRGKYVRPIQDGLWAESSHAEQRESLKMLKVLKKDIAPKVHRADISAIKDEMPQKTEFLIKIPLSELQKNYYTKYREDILGERNFDGVEAMSRSKQATYLFEVAYLMGLIVGHPAAFTRCLESRQQKNNDNKAILRENPIREVVDDELDEETIVEMEREQQFLLESENIDRKKHPWARELLDERGERIEDSGKLLVFKKIIDESKKLGDQILVFSHSTKILDALEYYVKEWKVVYQRLDGQTKASTRQKAAQEFNGGGSQVFIISTEAGGLGLNLPAANRVIIFDFKWSPMWEQQAIGRAYRLGQKKHVFVYRFLASGTFEESLWNMTQFKEQLQSRVVDMKNPMRSAVKTMKSYLNPLREVERSSDLGSMRGVDTIMDSLLDEDWIYDVVRTETFQPDLADELTPEEQREADMLYNEAVKLRAQKAEEERRAELIAKLNPQPTEGRVLDTVLFRDQLAAALNKPQLDFGNLPNPGASSLQKSPAKPDFSNLPKSMQGSSLIAGRPPPPMPKPTFTAPLRMEQSLLGGGARRASVNLPNPQSPEAAARRSSASGAFAREVTANTAANRTPSDSGSSRGSPVARTQKENGEVETQKNTPRGYPSAFRGPRRKDEAPFHVERGWKS